MISTPTKTNTTPSGLEIEKKSQIKYLGIMVSNTATFTDHIIIIKFTWRIELRKGISL